MDREECTMLDDDRDLPDGVIDANPAGGWEDGETADGETAESGAAVTDGWTVDLPTYQEYNDARDAAASDAAASADAGTDVGAVEGDELTRGTDPDMAPDPRNEEN
jgi:hypothetical protein